MPTEKNKFPIIHSKTSKGWTWVIKILFSTLLVMISLLMISLAVPSLSSWEIKAEVKVLIIILAVVTVGVFAWILIVTVKERSVKKITHIVVDNQGIHYYSDQDLVRSIKYTALMPNPEHGKYDVLIPLDQTDTDMSLCFYLFDDVLNKIKLQALTLNTDFVTTNGNSLKKHFIKGIVAFRPDLKVDPGIFDLYKLKRDL